MTPQRIFIGAHGDLVAVHSDALAALLAGVGLTHAQRASHVEPTSGPSLAWSADLSPVGGPRLGPFTTRAAALRAERLWLDNHLAQRAATPCPTK